MKMIKIFMTNFNDGLKESNVKLFSPDTKMDVLEDYKNELRKLATDDLRVCMSVVNR